MCSVLAPVDHVDHNSFADLLALGDGRPTQPPRPRKMTLAEMRESFSANASDKRTPVSAYEALNTTSDNQHLIQVLRDAEVSALVAELVAARAARGHRKVMRRPTRRRGQRDLFDVVRLHLRRLCRRVLNDRCREGVEPPPQDLLAAALVSYVESECWHLVYFQDCGDPREPGRVRRTYLDGERAVEAVAKSSARYALTTWQPDYMHTMQDLGRKGGTASRRPPKWNDADLDRLDALDGLTVSEQASALGVSASTVDRMRRALRSRADDLPDLDKILRSGKF